METELERIVRLETIMPALAADVSEMKDDVKSILEYQNRQRGAAKVAAVLWTGIIAIGGVFTGAHFSGH